MKKYFTLFILELFDIFHKKKIFNFLIKNQLRELKIMFDIGAHKGESISSFNKYLTIKEVYSFEASPLSYKILKSKLPNFKTRFKKTKLHIENLAVGSKNEKEGKTGFAHLFEHLMFNGTENYNSEYFEPFEKIGSTDQNGTTNSDRTNYFQNVPTNALDLALWMESDRMGHLLGVVDQEKLDEQRGVVQNEKRQGEKI